MKEARKIAEEGFGLSRIAPIQALRRSAFFLWLHQAADALGNAVVTEMATALCEAICMRLHHEDAKQRLATA